MAAWIAAGALAAALGAALRFGGARGLIAATAAVVALSTGYTVWVAATARTSDPGFAASTSVALGVTVSATALITAATLLAARALLRSLRK